MYKLIWVYVSVQGGKTSAPYFLKKDVPLFVHFLATSVWYDTLNFRSYKNNRPIANYIKTPAHSVTRDPITIPRPENILALRCVTPSQDPPQ